MNSHIFDYFNRWRHTLGYGVHSPLAYRIVTECVHPDCQYAYYADLLIQSESENSEMYTRLRLVIRLINTLRFRCIWIPGCLKKDRGIICGAFPNIRLSSDRKMPKNVDFIVIYKDKDASDYINQIENGPNLTLLMFHPEGNTDAATKSIIAGSGFRPTLTLSGKTFSILIHRGGMLPLEYTML